MVQVSDALLQSFLGELHGGSLLLFLSLHEFAIRLVRQQASHEFFFGETRVSVEVHAADDGEHVSNLGYKPMSPKK